MKQFTFILIMTLLSPALAYSQTNGGLHVNGSHNFMVPVDSLDIRPWAADFTVSFTIDFDSIKDNATTSLLGLRSREWDRQGYAVGGLHKRQRHDVPILRLQIL